MPIVLILVLMLCAGSAASQPQFDAQVAIGSAYNFRGVPQNEKVVLQPDLTVTLPGSGGGTFALIAWGNLDLADDTGRAVLPDGNGGHFSEVDFTVGYARPFGGLEAGANITSYNFPNGGPATTEVSLSLAGDLSGITSEVSVFYDFDQVDGIYVSGALAHSVPVAAKTSVDASVSLGVTDAGHAAAYYYTPSAGLADLAAEVSVSHRAAGAMSFRAWIRSASILDARIRTGVEGASIDPDNLWGGFTVGRNF